MSGNVGDIKEEAVFVDEEIVEHIAADARHRAVFGVNIEFASLGEGWKNGRERRRLDASGEFEFFVDAAFYFVDRALEGVDRRVQSVREFEKFAGCRDVDAFAEVAVDDFRQGAVDRDDSVDDQFARQKRNQREDSEEKERVREEN